MTRRDASVTVTCMARRRDPDQAVTEAIGVAVDAVIEKLEAPARVRAAVRALRYDHHMSIPAIATALYEGLRERGLSVDQIHGAGVSHDSIRLLVKEKP